MLHQISTAKFGINLKDNFEGHVKLWKEKGYTLHFMTGIVWGQYQDFFPGKYDGKTHSNIFIVLSEHLLKEPNIAEQQGKEQYTVAGIEISEIKQGWNIAKHYYFSYQTAAME